MKYSRIRLLFLMFGLLSLNNILFAQSNTERSQLKIIIIRHGEKPDKGYNLSCQGLNRSYALVNVLYDKFKLPSDILVPSIKTGKKNTKHARMSQTIDPFAKKYNLPIDSKFGLGDEAGLAKYLLEKKGTILVVWEHKNIPAIAQGLGVTTDKKLKWKGSDFDSIWIITFKNGKAELTTDKENINPSADCK